MMVLDFCDSVECVDVECEVKIDGGDIFDKGVVGYGVVVFKVGVEGVYGENR